MGNAGKKSRKSRQRRRMRVHKRSMLVIGAVIVLLTVVVSVGSMTLKAKEKAYKAQEIELRQQIEEEKKRAQEIDKLETYVGTDEYVEEMAREKLGMVYKDETIFKAK